MKNSYKLIFMILCFCLAQSCKNDMNSSQRKLVLVLDNSVDGKHLATRIMGSDAVSLDGKFDATSSLLNRQKVVEINILLSDKHDIETVISSALGNIKYMNAEKKLRKISFESGNVN